MGAVCGKQYKIEDIYDRANLAYRKTKPRSFKALLPMWEQAIKWLDRELQPTGAPFKKQKVLPAGGRVGCKVAG